MYQSKEMYESPIDACVDVIKQLLKDKYYETK